MLEISLLVSVISAFLYIILIVRLEISMLLKSKFNLIRFTILYSAQMFIPNFMFYRNIGLGFYCSFQPFQLIPYSHNAAATQFRQENNMTSCSLSSKKKPQAKFPNITNSIDLQWLDDSYVKFSVSNNILYFQVWKSTVMLFFLTLALIFLWLFSFSGQSQFQVCEAQLLPCSFAVSRAEFSQHIVYERRFLELGRQVEDLCFPSVVN